MLKQQFLTDDDVTVTEEVGRDEAFKIAVQAIIDSDSDEPESGEPKVEEGDEEEEEEEDDSDYEPEAQEGASKRKMK